MTNHDDLLVTVTGRDQPGITARLTGVLAEHGVELVDIEQVVVQGRLTLSLQIRLTPTPGVLEALALTARELGVTLDFAPVEDPASALRTTARRYVVTAIGRRLGAAELHALTSILNDHGAHLEHIEELSEGGLGTVELRVFLPEAADADALKRALLELGMRSAFDVALQPESLYRRSKRLVVMDMDSTLIRIEVIDELARAHGVVDQVSHITERAMQGELDYDQSLRERVALLKGLDASVLERISENLPLTEGAETLVRVIKRLGFRTAILSGGFSVAAQALQRRLGIDYAHSNVLEVQDGKLTGRVLGPIVNAQRKAELLESIARAEGILLDQVIAVGDGANDLLMLQKAGLGIAFRAKPKLREAADMSISAAGLDAILALLGMSAREVREAERG
ncbi:MAG: phosphoserine phosphatase SerB [Myxococcaceae bacterium]|nr:phosphoserine phosphatase SerB [Myxococcaceae bacterium]